MILALSSNIHLGCYK